MTIEILLLQVNGVAEADLHLARGSALDQANQLLERAEALLNKIATYYGYVKNEQTVNVN